MQQCKMEHMTRFTSGCIKLSGAFRVISISHIVRLIYVIECLKIDIFCLVVYLVCLLGSQHRNYGSISALLLILLLFQHFYGDQLDFQPYCGNDLPLPHAMADKVSPVFLFSLFPKKSTIRKNCNSQEILILRCGAFYLYAGLALLGWVTFLLLLPETQGRQVPNKNLQENV